MKNIIGTVVIIACLIGFAWTAIMIQTEAAKGRYRETIEAEMAEKLAEKLEEEQTKMIQEAIEARSKAPYRMKFGDTVRELGPDDQLLYDVPAGYVAVVWREGEEIHIGYTDDPLEEQE